MKPYQKKYKPKEGKRNTRWTDEDRALLRTLADQGMSHWDIGKRLDRSPGAISQQLYMLRVAPKYKPWTAKDIQAAKTLRAQGVSQEYVAKQLGRSPNAISMRLYKENKKPVLRGPKYKPWTDEDRALLRTLADQGVPHSKIAERLKCTTSAVRAQLYQMRRREEHPESSETLQKQSESSETLPNKSWWRRLLGI